MKGVSLLRCGNMAYNGGWTYTDKVDGIGESALGFYCSRYRHSDEAEWRRRFLAGEISLNGRTASGGERVVSGDVLQWRRPAWNEGRFADDVPIVYEDDSMVAVDKPAGLATAPDGGWLENTLVGWLKRRFPRETVAPAHRLNRGASGLVLCGRTAHARARLAELFRERTAGDGRCIEKTYLAVTAPYHGLAPGERITIDRPIGRAGDFLCGSAFAASDDGVQAKSECEVVERNSDRTVWRVGLITGRAHQIRAHLASIGAPLLGDSAFLADGRPNPLALPGACGYFLRAVRVSLPHPSDGRRIALEVPWMLNLPSTN